MALVTMNMEARMIKNSFPKEENASEGLSTPVLISATNNIKVTTSTESFSVINKTMANKSRPSVIAISIRCCVSRSIFKKLFHSVPIRKNQLIFNKIYA